MTPCPRHRERWPRDAGAADVLPSDHRVLLSSPTTRSTPFSSAAPCDQTLPVRPQSTMSASPTARQPASTKLVLGLALGMLVSGTSTSMQPSTAYHPPEADPFPPEGLWMKWSATGAPLRARVT